MNSQEKINIPQGAYTYVIGKNSKNVILYSQYGVKVLMPDKNTIVIECDDPIKLRKVKMDILSNISNKYSIFEHPSIITNLLVYNGRQSFQFKKYKEDIQDKYRIIYTHKQTPQIVKAIEPTGDWQLYTRSGLSEALDRNKNISFEVTIGRNIFYSSNKTKEIRGIEDKLYYLSNFRTMTIGYGKDIKVKWDPILSQKQSTYVMNILVNDKNILPSKQYVKSGSVIVNMKDGSRIHCSLRIRDNVPQIETFKAKIEKPIKETIIINRLDSFPDIRYKFTVPSSKISNINIEDISIQSDMTMEPKDVELYQLTYSYVNNVIKYDIDGITIKFIHNIFDNGTVIKFSSKTNSPLDILDYINDMFGIK